MSMDLLSAILSVASVATVLLVIWWLLRPPRFCPRCGSAVEVAEWVSGYHTRSGKPIVRHFLRCPRSSEVAPDWYGDSRVAVCFPTRPPGSDRE